MRFNLFLVIYIFSNIALSAQKGSIYVEFLGNSPAISFNYDTRFSSSDQGFGGRIGTAIFKDEDDYYYFNIPMQLNYLIGTAPHYFESGFGLSIVKYPKSKDFELIDYFSGTLLIGYRRQPLESGFVWRIGLTPFIHKELKLPLLIGFSLGYKIG